MKNEWKPEFLIVIYTKFISLVSCSPVVQTLLPLDPQGIAVEDDEIFRLTTKDSRLTIEKGASPANEQPSLPSDIVFEQSPEQLLNALAPICFNPSGNVTEVRAAHPENAYLPICSTESGKLIVRSFSHL